MDEEEYDPWFDDSFDIDDEGYFEPEVDADSRDMNY